MKRTLSLLLALLMAGSILVSCAGDSGSTSDTTADTTIADGETTAASDASTETARTDIKDTLPEYDMKGEDFVILVGETFQKWLMSHELDGDILNDTLVESTTAVEERFNVNIKPYLFPATTQAYQSECRQWALAGEDIYDLATIHDLSASQLSLEGLLVNIYDIPHLNFDMPWWQEYLIEVMTFRDQMYIFANSIDLQALQATRVFFFNKKLVNDYDIENPYTTVFDDKWTLDYVISTTKDIYQDLNGNSTRDDEDLYGYASSGAFYGYLEGFDVEVIKKTDDGGLELDANNNKVITLVEKHYDWLYDSTGARHIFGATTGVNDKATLFANEKLVFTYGPIGDAFNTFRFSDVDYGLLPMPKYDENQANYMAACTARPYFVPITNDDLERTGIIIEAMSAEGYKNNFPVFYDIALKDKYLYDEEAAEILDIIYENTVLSFSYMYEKNASGFSQTISHLINTESPSKDFASYYASKEASVLARIDEIVEAFEKMEN